MFKKHIKTIKKLTVKQLWSVSGIVAFTSLCAVLISAEGIEGYKSYSKLKQLNGVWQSDGYGWTWQIEDGEVTRYDATKNYCSQRKKTKSINELTNDIMLSAGQNRMRVSFDDTTYYYTFTRTYALPSACETSQEDDAASVLNSIDEYFRAHYAFFKTRNINWSALMGKARQSLNEDASDLELYETISDLLEALKDAHVSLEAKIKNDDYIFESGLGPTLEALSKIADEENKEFSSLYKRWRKEYISNVHEDILDGEGKVAANGQLIYGIIDDDIGYLNILSMDGFSDNGDSFKAIDKALDEIIDEFEDVDALIIDISLNDGGYDGYARHIAERFTSKRQLAYYKYAGDSRDQQKQAIYLENRKKSKYTGPIYLLTSDVTLSAAEIFTLAMRTLPHVTPLGQKTRGSLSDILNKTLPNGWKLSLSNEVYLDDKGTLWEGKGIPPKISFDVFNKDDVFEGHSDAVQKIVKMIQGT